MSDNDMVNTLRKIIKNKIFLYLSTRYGILALSFITSLMIAGKLGPYYFGIYGFVLLIISYFGQIHLGIPNSLNVLLVHNKTDKQKSNQYISNALSLYIYFTIVIVLLYLAYIFWGFEPIKRYHADSYLIAICVIAVLEYVNGVLLCVLRIKNMINLMSIVTSIKTILNLIFVILFNGELLIFVLVSILIVSNVITIIICACNQVIPPISDFKIKISIQKEILKKGVLLFLYNTCFYFIVISIRSIISGNYKIEEFGSFTFSFSIVSGVMVLLDSLMTIMFPKIVDLLSSKDYDQINHTLNIIRVAYVSTAHLLIYIAMLFYPFVIFYLLPGYHDSLIALNLISLSLLMNANSTGYSTLLIAQNKEKYSAFISISSLILNVALAILLVYVFEVSYSFVIFATMITYLYFSFSVVVCGKKIINQFNWRDTILQFFPVRLLIPFMIAIFVTIINKVYLLWMPLFVYILLNINDLKKIKHYTVKIVNNENISDINR